MTVLKIMCGVPAAGKTTYIKNHANPSDLVISRDEIRRSMITPGIPYFSKDTEVFNEFCSRINVGIKKYDVIWADATHLNNTSRWKLLYNIDRFALEKIIFVCIEHPFSVYVERNNQRTGIEHVPDKALKQMYDSYKRPSLNDFLSLNVEIEVIK